MSISDDFNSLESLQDSNGDGLVSLDQLEEIKASIQLQNNEIKTDPEATQTLSYAGIYHADLYKELQHMDVQSILFNSHQATPENELQHELVVEPHEEIARLLLNEASVEQCFENYLTVSDIHSTLYLGYRQQIRSQAEGNTDGIYLEIAYLLARIEATSMPQSSIREYIKIKVAPHSGNEDNYSFLDIKDFLTCMEHKMRTGAK